jgi:hypothetical protein
MICRARPGPQSFDNRLPPPREQQGHSMLVSGMVF